MVGQVTHDRAKHTCQIHGQLVGKGSDVAQTESQRDTFVNFYEPLEALNYVDAVAGRPPQPARTI